MPIPPPPLPPAAALGWIPVPVLNAAFAEAMALMRRRHASIFERIADLGAKTVRIEPLDLPMTLTLTLGGDPRLRVTGAAEAAPAAVLRGAFADLVDLLQGRCDGDGLFFQRALAVEGDMAVIVGLRNAVDGEPIDLWRDLLSVLWPPESLLRGVAARLGAPAPSPPLPATPWRRRRWLSRGLAVDP